ncbi:complement C1q-like protein 4 [Mya arenaria]|uniref:complement C1q-like protein 4 n=1 Tax=Mya arenaria TaxID=6604 RepID=UPI0022E3C410|nr:complement C1q-like protein 4 [Mya arenaria]
MWRLFAAVCALVAGTAAFLEQISSDCTCPGEIAAIKDELMKIRGNMSMSSSQAALISQLQANLTTLQQTVHNLSRVTHHPQAVAFTAQLTKSLSNIQEGQEVMFDKVITNVGHGYDNNTGNFTAPYNGTYIFFLTITSSDIHKASFRLVKNGHRILNVNSIPTTAHNHTIPETNTHVVTVNMHVGDKVWAVNQGGFDAHEGLTGNLLTSFSGHLLQPHFRSTSPTVV